MAGQGGLPVVFVKAPCLLVLAAPGPTDCDRHISFVCAELLQLSLAAVPDSIAVSCSHAAEMGGTLLDYPPSSQQLPITDHWQAPRFLCVGVEVLVAHSSSKCM